MHRNRNPDPNKGVGSPDELRDKWRLVRSCITLDACRKVRVRVRVKG